MRIWDTFGNMQNALKQSPGVMGPFNQDGRPNFGATLDTVANLPKDPMGYNRKAEELRLGLLEKVGENLGTKESVVKSLPLLLVPGVGGPLVGLNAAAFGLGELDKKTDGKASATLMAATKGLRSNYAFVSDIARHDAGMGMLATFNLIAGGALGGVAGFLVGGPVGAIAGATLGAGVAGKIGRDVSQTGVFGQTAKKSADFSESAEGQKKYNFGTDATRLAGKIVGLVPGETADNFSNVLRDTNRGIGASVAGIFNFGFEITAAPDIKAVKLGGIGLRSVIGGSVAATQTSRFTAANLLAKTETANLFRADKLDANVDLINRTVAGEKTSITPLMEFNRDNSVSTILERVNFKNNPNGVVGANLVSGKSFEEQGLIFRIGIGDKAAIAELKEKSPSTFAEMLRQEGVFDTIEARNPFASSKLPDHDMLQGRVIEAEDIVKAEILDLRKKYSWINNALKLDSALQDTAFSPLKGVEQFRNDMAKQRATNKIEANVDDITSRETRAGRVVQTIYQRNGSSVVIRTIQRGINGLERGLDDAPHQTVNFNDSLQSTTRVRTTMRTGINRKILTPLEAKNFYDSFLSARGDAERFNIIEKIEERVFEQAANKYNVPASIKDLVLTNYITLSRKNMKKAREANAKNEAYMIENGEVIKDAQLVTQLANGAYLPDIELIDKAFARFAKKRGAEASLPVNAAIIGNVIYEEFNSLWRSFTLARTGFPINIIRDSTLRTWGDGVLLYSLFNLSKTGVDAMLGGKPRITEMRNWSKGIVDPKQNIKKIREDIGVYDNAIKDAERGLKTFKYDPLNPPKDMPDDLIRNLKYLEDSKKMVTELRRQENALIKNIPSKVVGPDKINVLGYNFPAGLSGRFAEIDMAKLRGKDTARGLLASTRQLEMNSVRRDRNNDTIKAIDGEDIHLQAWDTLLNNILRFDEVSREIMSRNSKNMDAALVEKEVVQWIRSSGSKDLFERFGYDANFRTQMKVSDARVIYQKALAAINQFAPDIKLQQAIISDKVNIIELKKMYPDITKRPDIISDLALDLTGQSLLVRQYSDLVKKSVAWLATAVPAVLSYNPYYMAKYENKLQSMVATANAQGRRLDDMDKKQFEAVARADAMKEFKAKINAFNRDMNYHGILDLLFAFFPAIVEQWRAYGRLTLDHPEFPQKILAMQEIPDYLGDVKVDQYGTEYTEVELPVLGIKGRLPVSWWDPINPTGGHILSTSPYVTTAYNEVSKRKDLPDYFTKMILPFGSQASVTGALTPSTLRRAGQAFEAFVFESGGQFNKDMSMFIEMKRKEFVDTYGVDPSGTDMNEMRKEAQNDTLALSVIRALGAGILPNQPRYVSPLEQYADLLGVYTKNYGAEGVEKFTNDYPEYYMLADKLTDPTSGIRDDDTAVELLRRNTDTVGKIVSNIDKGNLSVLGSIFNDEDYAFSSSARAYLLTNSIPGTSKRFKGEADALDVALSSTVNKGWREWNSLIEIVSQEIVADNLTPAKGYGKSILDSYKKRFIANMETKNNLWYKEKVGGNFSTKRNNTVDAITIAVNTPKLWADLAKQPRWHAIVDYLNFRYYVKEELEIRGAAITSDKAVDIRDKVNVYVQNLRDTDINFGKFYDRYFDEDTFDYVYTEVVKGEK